MEQQLDAINRRTAAVCYRLAWCARMVRFIDRRPPLVGPNAVWVIHGSGDD